MLISCGDALLDEFHILPLFTLLCLVLGYFHEYDSNEWRLQPHQKSGDPMACSASLITWSHGLYKAYDLTTLAVRLVSNRSFTGRNYE